MLSRGRRGSLYRADRYNESKEAEASLFTPVSCVESEREVEGGQFFAEKGSL